MKLYSHVESFVIMFLHINPANYKILAIFISQSNLFVTKQILFIITTLF